ncbi:uncharacterized protein BKA55DRAFT_657506 [Fusarium redolens]|uniref:Rhodopsin domain-containing protein n=1 Tax=Fusarium redolens TaxID=48865 RepID=A0A9P9FYN1_FUSRE|nr:uncharacterized protein BKA55DRAFT_657506 [Fusarium redolens]KAH7207821.1 hypothetical protein BKA55DRAFT_657506 [Fusarium redolens]
MAGLQPNIWAGVAIPWLAALTSLILRVCARRMTKMSWWFDDYFTILAFLFATGYCGIMVEWTLHTYLGVNIPDSMPTDEREAILQQARFLAYFNSLCYASSIACSKLAILCLYWRLFRISSIRIPIMVMLVMVVIWIIIRTFMLTFRCVPVQSLWDYTITDKVCNINSDQFFLGTITTHFIMDIAILALPIIEVFRLRLRTGQKLAIGALFLLGTIVCFASMFVLVELVNYPDNTTQMPHDYAMFCILGSVEVNIAIVSACFPLLRPIFVHVLPSSFLSSYGKSSQPISRPSNAIKLTTLIRTNKDREADETSSTHQLADLENGLHYHSGDVQRPEGVHTMILSEQSGSGPEDDAPGIYVRNDTVLNNFLPFFAYLAGHGALATPKQDTLEVDVAIVGGGATGAYAAVRLREDYGKKVVVIEKQNRLGGHVHAYKPGPNERPINYGVQAYLDRKTTKAFFKRFNVGLISPDVISSAELLFATKDVDFNTGKKVDPDYGAINSTVALAAYAALAAKYQPWFENGYFKKGEVPEDLLLPFGEFLEKYRLGSALSILRTLIWLSDATHTPTWNVMAVVGEPQLAAFGFGLAGPTFKWPETYSSETLYDRVYDLIKDDVLLESTVAWSKRTSQGSELVVQTPSGKKNIKAKKVLFAATPSPDNVGTWDLDTKEKSLFSKFSWETLYVGVVGKTSLPKDVAGIRDTPDNATNFYLPRGNFVDAYTRAGEKDLWTTRVLGQANLTAQKAKSLIKQVFTNIDKAGTYDVTTPDIVAFASHGLTVPKVCAQELEGGFYNKIYALQGQRNTFWTGLTWAPDYTPILWDFTEKLFPQILSGL